MPNKKNGKSSKEYYDENPASKKKKQAYQKEYNKKPEQVETSSAVIAVLADVEMYKRAEEIYNASFEQGFMPREIADMMIENTVKLYSGLPQETLKNIVNFDAGLISMQIMLLAKELGYDTVPMGGFNKAQFAEKFELPQNEIPVLLIAIGEAENPRPSYQNNKVFKSVCVICPK